MDNPETRERPRFLVQAYLLPPQATSDSYDWA